MHSIYHINFINDVSHIFDIYDIHFYICATRVGPLLLVLPSPKWPRLHCLRCLSMYLSVCLSVCLSLCGSSSLVFTSIYPYFYRISTYILHFVASVCIYSFACLVVCEYTCSCDSVSMCVNAFVSRT